MNTQMIRIKNWTAHDALQIELVLLLVFIYCRKAVGWQGEDKDAWAVYKYLMVTGTGFRAINHSAKRSLSRTASSTKLFSV